MNIQYDNNKSYVEISPILAKFNDPVECTRLYASIINDNLSTHALIQYKVCDQFGSSYLLNNIEISGGDYLEWSGDNEYVFTFVADKIGIVII